MSGERVILGLDESSYVLKKGPKAESDFYLDLKEGDQVFILPAKSQTIIDQGFLSLGSLREGKETGDVFLYRYQEWSRGIFKTNLKSGCRNRTNSRS